MDTERWKYLRYKIEERLPDLHFRKSLNRHPQAVIAVAAVSTLIFLIILIVTSISNKPPKLKEPEKDWFYDLNTGKLFTAPRNTKPPVPAPSGPLPNGKPAGVKAYVFAYDTDPNESERLVAFLVTTDPNAPPHDDNKKDRPWGKGLLIKTPDQEKWMPADSKQSRKIQQDSLVPNNNGELPSYYPPP